MEAMVTVQPYLPELISGAIHTIFNVGLVAFVYFLFWLWKRKISKSDEKGPVLHQKEHDEKAKESHKEIIKAIADGRQEQKVDMGEMRKDNTASFRRVHERIDGLLEVKR